MNIDQLLACSEVLGEMLNNFAAMPTHKEEAAQAALHLAMVQLYVTEYAAHLTNGLEPYDALVATAKGELKIPPSASGAALVFQILAAKPKK